MPLIFKMLKYCRGKYLTLQLSIITNLKCVAFACKLIAKLGVCKVFLNNVIGNLLKEKTQADYK